MRELIIVRHGEADHMVTGITGGWSDCHLTALGRRQAELTGPAIAAMIGDRPFQFYTSDLSRAAETAEIVAESLPTEPVRVPALRELNNGAAANLTKDEAAQILIPITQPMVDWAPYPDAESWAAMSRRVMEFMDRAFRDEHDLTVLVMHCGSANAAIHWWLRLAVGGQGTAFDLDACSISRFGINQWNERTVSKLNDTSHLLAL